MLEYVALAIIFFVVIVLFYGIFAIHDIPYEIARRRNHPHQDAIHVTGWISVLTLHVIWPFLWIWATLYREDGSRGFADGQPVEQHVARLEIQVADLAARLDALDSGGDPARHKKGEE